MESSGNQRKRGVRMGKNANVNEKSPSPNEVVENSAVAISPTLEESESANITPPSECRRSSRKKIIKFDVRDLLNKNRKTHKIQIEARIDSNAPSTSKTTTIDGIAVASTKTSAMTREDMLSKHKTFLEKSAIFRRYSVSQEQKPPPPPLPIPPLLGKSSDNKDSGLCGTSSSQEFLSHALIKPKQPTSLIVAQIESNKPSSVTAAKRKSLNKTVDINADTNNKPETRPMVQQKKRGRPAKIKIRSPEESQPVPSVREECSKKNIAPEKAKNWKEYKACLAQQSSCRSEQKGICQAKEETNLTPQHQTNKSPILLWKQDNFNESLQLDMSRSDDDGSFSGFQISKDDTSCDSPVLEKCSSGKELNTECVANFAKSNENTVSKDKVDSDKKAYKIKLTYKDTETKQIEEESGEENFNLDVCKSQKRNEAETLLEVGPTVLKETKTVKRSEYKTCVENIELFADKSIKDKHFIKPKENLSDITQSDESSTVKSIHVAQNITNGDEYLEGRNAPLSTPRIEIVSKRTCKTQRDPKREENKNIMSYSEKIENKKIGEISIDKRQPKDVQLETETAPTISTDTPLKSQTDEKNIESSKITATDTLSKAKENEILTTEKKTAITLSTEKMTSTEDVPLPYEGKLFSLTSSSSESENTSDRSSYSSEPFTTTSSSSQYSNNFGDKVKADIRQISLPKSPSTSSQTSTSEEINNADIVVKRKNPTTKRSKRLQKKFNVLLGDPNHVEVSHGQKPASNAENKNQSETNACSSKVNKIKVHSLKLVENYFKDSTAEDSIDTSNDRILPTEVSAILSESSNTANLKTVDRNIKEKSLKSSSCQNDEYFLNPKCEETQKKLVIKGGEEIQPRQETEHEKLASKNNKLKEIVDENKLQNENSSASDHSYKTEDNEKRKTRKYQATNRNQFEKSSSEVESVSCTKEESEIWVAKEEAIDETQNITKANVNKTNSVDEPNIANEILSEAKETKTEIGSSNNSSKDEATRSKKVDVEIGIKNFNPQQEIEFDPNLGENQKNLSNQSYPRKETSICKKTETHIRKKAKPTGKKSTDVELAPKKTPINSKVSKTDLEKDNGSKRKHYEVNSKIQKPCIKSDSEEKKIDKEGISTNQSKNVEEKVVKLVEETTSKMQISSKNNGGGKIESGSGVTLVETAAKTDIFGGNKTNTEEISPKVLQIQDTNQFSHDTKATDSLRTEIFQQSISENVENVQDQIKSSHEKSLNCESEKIDDTLINKETTCNKIIQKDNVQLKEKKYSLEECFGKQEAELLNHEKLHTETLSSTQTGNKTHSQKSAEVENVAIPEKLTTKISTRSRRSKEEVSTKVSSVQKENAIHSTKEEADVTNQLKEDERESAIKEYTTVSNSSKELKKSKADPSEGLFEDKEAEVSTSELKKQSGKDIKAQSSKSDIDSSKSIPTNKKDLTEVISAMKSKEDKGTFNEISPNSSKSKKASGTLKVYKSSSEVPEKSNIDLPSSTVSSKRVSPKASIENLAAEPNSSVNMPSKPSKTIPLKHYKSSPVAILGNMSVEINKTNETEEVLENFNTTTLQENTLQEKADSPVAVQNLTKRRSRKSRFKNLHGPDDSETDSSNGKITPIDDLIHQKLKTELKVALKEKVKGHEKQNPQQLQESDSKVLEVEKKHENITIKENDVCDQKDDNTNFLSSQIKNVSIETNTLLDILRTVQSNTEAALKACKSPTNVGKTDIQHAIESETNANVDETSKTSQNLLKNQQKSETNSTINFDSGSPLTTKKPNLSPARSDSNSPLTLKKMIPSPTRSTSSSPLTLKKVTRRYERRSLRGEDSTHKTLEETFAEIAAQSSKAVLAAKEFDEKPHNEVDDNNTTSNAENEQVNTYFPEKEKTSEPSQISFNSDKNADEVFSNVSQDKPDSLTVHREAIVADSTENVFGVETTQTIPAKRGRKQKSRSSELTTVTKGEAEIINAPKTKEDINDEVKMIKLQMDSEEKTENYDHDKNEVIHDKGTESIETSLNDLSKSLSPVPIQPQVTSTPIPTEEISKPVEDINEFKSSKKSNKKRDSKVTTEEDTLLSNKITCQEEGEIRTPKQPIKKRDASQSNSDSKSAVKKVSKKTKNEEEDSLNIQKEDTILKNIASTTPPPKRGRKPKCQQPETPQSSSKKKNKKDICSENDDEEEDDNEEKVNILINEFESSNTSEKSTDEKLAKKKRQKKLKEAFEAALTDNKGKNRELLTTETCSPTRNLNFGFKVFTNSPPSERCEPISNEDRKLACLTPTDTEEDPDPLKDIEKFIADGVNLLKKDYKLDEDSVDDVLQTTLTKTTKTAAECIKTTDVEVKSIFNTFETPAYTPIHTPSITPPPKSPSSIEPTTPDENSGVRRSHRIKLITKTPKALVGRGLVRDRERFSIKDDVETKTHYTLDDHLTDLAEVEAKNAKFLKDMEERLSNFQVIKENDYLCERVISKEAKKMICDCFLTHEEEDRGELGCGEDCLNRLLMIECGLECNVKERCTNKRFQKLLCSPCRVFRTEKKGFGIMADIEILPGEFIMEYVGEVIDTEEFGKRRIMYSQDKNRHYYFMALRSDAIIDATIKGNISRFINHSCDPNAETQKWTVNGELRIGFFSRKSIMPGEEITFNYQYQRYGREAQRCYCESSNCTGWIGQEPTSDEGEQMDDEYDESEDEEEEETDNSNLLVQDDEDDSDASVADPEEVQKQLEMAAAQAEVELAPLQLIDGKTKQTETAANDGKSAEDTNKSEEDSKSKFKKLLSKMAEKVAAKQKQNKREQKLQRKKKSKKSSSELTNKLRFLEDPDIEDEVEFLKECGLKNQSDTLRLSRLMVRAKLVQTRLNLLEILRKGDLPCRRLFLDYHGLRLLHGWMSEDAGNMQIRLSLLQTLETLPIANKTVLTDSKVMQAVRIWSGPNNSLPPNEDSSSSNSNSQDIPIQGSTTFEEESQIADLQKLALKLIATWEGLQEIFRIPKKERIEQMKEHEREADRQYAANAETQENITFSDRYRRDRFGRGLNTFSNTSTTSNRFTKPNNGNPLKTTSIQPKNSKNLSKAQRREMFAAKVARDEVEKRLAEERREFETKCRFFGLDPKKTRAQDMPFCVNPTTGQWFSSERKPITTPPSYAHVQVPVKPKTTNPNDYQLPVVCSTLPPQWKYAITPQGKIYYYHIKHRLPQWEPPSQTQLQQCELEAREEESESEITSNAGEDSSDDDDEILIGMDAAQLKAYIDRKVELRRQRRYQRLVDERSISPRREEDRIYNQIEVRKYKENKEKIRKRKEDIRRKRAEALRQTSLNLCTLGSITDANPSTSKSNTENSEDLGTLPIQDYLLSSDEEVDLKAEVNSPLIDKIVEGDKIVDELDALTTKRQLKRPLPPHRDLNEPSTSSASSVISNVLAAKQEYKKRKLEKKEKRKPKEQDAKYRKNKEKFRCEIAGIIVHHLKPYLKETCTLGRIKSNEDFNHLARKLTHFVMIKELKYCESVGQTLVVTESVKSKSREFIKKYMAKYGGVYIKPVNDPDFKDIPFTL